MTLTNGEDQSAAFERELGRQGLEQVREKTPFPVLRPDDSGPARPPLADFEITRTLARRDGTFLEQPNVWNVGVEYESATDRKNYTASFSVRSRQRPTGLAEGYKSICQRWSLDALGIVKLLHLEEEVGLCDLILSGHVPPMTGDLKDRMALVIGISIGLGELFDDNKGAELRWLTSDRLELGGVTPLEHMLEGDLLNVRDVVDLVDNARGLK